MLAVGGPQVMQRTEPSVFFTPQLGDATDTNTLQVIPCLALNKRSLALQI